MTAQGLPPRTIGGMMALWLPVLANKRRSAWVAGGMGEISREIEWP